MGCILVPKSLLCKSYDIERVQDAGGVFNTGRKYNGGVGVKKGYIYTPVPAISWFN